MWKVFKKSVFYNFLYFNTAHLLKGINTFQIIRLHIFKIKKITHQVLFENNYVKQIS